MLNILAFSCLSCAWGDIKTIESARKLSTGQEVKICGIITNGNELGTIRFIQDTTAGIAIFSNLLHNVSAGDSLCVSGTLSKFNELLQISPVTDFNVISNNNTLPKPKIIDLNQALSGEYESQLVRIPNLHFKEKAWFNANQNYKIYQDTLEGEMRIYNNTDLIFKSIPLDTLIITGIMSRYRNIYQLIPRSFFDFEATKGPFIINQPNVTEILPGQLNLNFITRRPGQSIVRYGKTPVLEKGMLVKTKLVKNHTFGISSLKPATFYYVQALSVDENMDTSRSPIRYLSTASHSGGEIKVYFNNETDHSVAKGTKAININKSIPDTVVAYINRATVSIDWAVYNFNNKNLSINISNALNAAYHRGVRVRVIANGNTANFGLNDLHPEIPVLRSPDDDDHTIMHHKFIIFDVNAPDPDKAIVWTGSTNFTEYQINRDPNHVIIIYDRSLARAYLMEFEEMWGTSDDFPDLNNSRFGAFKKTNTPDLFNIGGSKVRLFFSPPQATQLNILKNIHLAEKEIYTAVFAFTQTELAQALVDRHYDGIFVSSIFDNNLSSNKPVYDILNNHLDSTLVLYQGQGTLHHKYMISDPNHIGDNTSVITGSYNWSRSASNYNDENTLIIYNADIAGQFYQEWLKRYKESGGIKVYQTGMGLNEFEYEDTEKLNLINTILLEHDPKILISGNFTSDLNLELIDLNGKNIFSKNFKNENFKDTLEVTLPQTLKSDVYLLYIKNESQIMVEKMIRLITKP